MIGITVFVLFASSYIMFIALRADELRSRELVFKHLDEQEEMTAHQLVEASNGYLDKTTINKLLGKMQREGLLESHEKFEAGKYLMEGTPPIILYRLTQTGKDAYKQRNR